MGLGGYLTWTALAREIYHRTGKKIIPIESHGNMIKVVKSSSFDNNPYIVQDLLEDGNKMVFPISLNNPKSNYCLSDRHDKAIHKSDKHIIQTLCEPYGIQNPTIKCDLFLTEDELVQADDLLSAHGISGDFFCIEPISKKNYTVNRQYDFGKWQNVVNALSKEYKFVQLGVSESAVLENVASLVGKTNFRVAAAIIAKSKALLASEGGLVHVANAVDTKAIVVLTGYQSKKMVSYDGHVYIDISSHGPCGLKIQCPDCLKDVENHDEKEIIEACRKIMTL